MRAGAGEHGGICRIDRRRENWGAGLEHGDNAACVRWRFGTDDSELGPDERVRGTGQMRADADPGAFVSAGRSGDGGVRDGVSGRQTDHLRKRGRTFEGLWFRGAGLEWADGAGDGGSLRARGAGFALLPGWELSPHV